METTDLTAGPVPADPAPDAPAPLSPDEEEEPGSRRKLILLLLMLLILLLLALVTAWYLLFHKPLTMIPGITAPEAMPTYQGSLYNVSKPQSVAVSTDATRIVITQTGTSLETVMFDRQGNKVGVLAPPSDQVPSPHQLFVATNPVTGEFWTTDRLNGLAAVYSSSGKFEKLVDPGTALENWQPLGIGFDKAGDVYIADVSNGPAVIHEFGPDGKELRSFGTGQNLDHPNGIAVAGDGTTYVTDTGNGQLKIFDPSGALIGQVDRGASAGNLGLPVGIGFDDHGNVLVVDSSSARVQVYQPLASGQQSLDYINAFGEKGSGDAQFSYPNGLAADSQGRVYVADWGNDRLEIWGY
jgi:sugar lactone lactonase YvrE